MGPVEYDYWLDCQLEEELVLIENIEAGRILTVEETL